MLCSIHAAPCRWRKFRAQLRQRLWQHAAMTLVGIDGCRSGWIAVVISNAGEVSAHHLYLIDDVAAVAPDAKVIAIDIPIGLPEAGRRQADLAARDFLGRRRNSVFHTPVRAALEAATHAEATAASLRVTGAGTFLAHLVHPLE